MQMLHSPHIPQRQGEKKACPELSRRVCFISGEYPPMEGGVGDHTFHLAGALGKEGVSASVITSKRVSSPVPGPPVHPVVKGWNFLSWPAIDEFVGKGACHILHIQYQTAAFEMHPAINLFPYWLRLRRKKLHVVVTMHDLREPYLFPKAGPLRRWLTAALISGSDGVVVTNGADLDAVSRMLGDGGKSRRPLVRLIPLGNNLPKVVPRDFDRSGFRKRWGLGEKDLVLSYFGLLNQSKGVDVILKGLGQLLKRGLAVKLLIIGGGVGGTDPTNQAYRERMLSIIEELGLGEAVIETGYLLPEEVSAALTSSDICLLPFNDGASFRRTTLLTALSHGLPIVTTMPQNLRAVELAPYREIKLVHRENCLMVLPQDFRSLAGAVEELVAQPALRGHIAQEAMALGGAFSWDIVAQRTAEFYGELLARD